MKITYIACVFCFFCFFSFCFAFVYCPNYFAPEKAMRASGPKYCRVLASRFLNYHLILEEITDNKVKNKQKKIPPIAANASPLTRGKGALERVGGQNK